MRAGETILNKKTGEILTMLESEADNGGARQVYQVILPPRRPSPPLHYHIAFTETFTVVEGSLDLYLGRERRHRLLQRGESATAGVGQLHTFANDRERAAIIKVETNPAGGVVRAFQLAYRVAKSGGAAEDGLPRKPFVRLLFIATSGGFVPALPLLLPKDRIWRSRSRRQSCGRRGQPRIFLRRTSSCQNLQ
jgi:quercetin dioxygenase-like cupin family protein